jgi:lipid-A-disaccharide synthase
MLTILPFEQAIYQQHNIPVQFVGHPLADDFPIENDTGAARVTLGLEKSATVVALLPGSRSGEVKLLAPLFFQTALHLDPKLVFLVPAANAARLSQIQEIYAQQLILYPELGQLAIDIRLGESQLVMAASDAVLMASGTTTLEALLLKKPMVVSYKKDRFSAWLIRKLIKTPFISLPNLLAGEALVPEILQEQAYPENLAEALNAYLQDPTKVARLQSRFEDIHRSLQQDAGPLGAGAIKKLIDEKKELNHGGT